MIGLALAIGIVFGIGAFGFCMTVVRSAPTRAHHRYRICDRPSRYHAYQRQPYRHVRVLDKDERR